MEETRKHIKFWIKAYEDAEKGIPGVTVPKPQVALGHILDEIQLTKEEKERVLGPWLSGWSRAYECGCIHSVESYMFRCDQHKDTLPALPDWAVPWEERNKRETKT